MAARAHSSSNWPPGAPLTPIAPTGFPPAMTVTPPTAYVTLGSGVCGTVVAGFLAIRSATAFVLSSLRASVSRSEEHTSELQSLAYLVCRLLLEKKKKIYSLQIYQ